MSDIPSPVFSRRRNSSVWAEWDFKYEGLCTGWTLSSSTLDSNPTSSIRFKYVQGILIQRHILFTMWSLAPTVLLAATLDQSDPYIMAQHSPFTINLEVSLENQLKILDLPTWFLPQLKKYKGNFRTKLIRLSVFSNWLELTVTSKDTAANWADV